MFTDNKYTIWYFGIIENARKQSRKKTSSNYYERHHIIPKCKAFGGDNSKDNLVLLTAREHYICHLLLTKMCLGDKMKSMCWALHKLSGSIAFSRRSRSYELVRKIHSKNLSLNHPAYKDPEAYSKRMSDLTTEKWNGENAQVNREHQSKKRSEYIADNKDIVDAHCRNVAKLGAQAISTKWKDDVVWAEKEKAKMSARVSGEKNGMFGKKLSDDVKKKLSESTSQRRWVNKDGKNAYIHFSVLDEHISLGYNIGKLQKRRESR